MINFVGIGGRTSIIGFIRLLEVGGQTKWDKDSIIQDHENDQEVMMSLQIKCANSLEGLLRLY